jgi:futalosine hydrolase
MKLVIAAATELELQPFIHLMGVKNGLSIEGWITGVGSIATTYFLSENVSNQFQHLIIQVGISGCFSDAFGVGTAVVVQDEMINDMGVFENNSYQDLFGLGLLNENTAPFSNGMLHNHHDILIKKTNLPLVRSMSVNEISTNAKKISLFKDVYKADIETMEGSAFHYVCLMRNIPFVQIRGISNVVGERDKSNWKIKEAIESIFPPLQNLISFYSANPGI